MGILKKITDEYFGDEMRDEDKHPLNKYLRTVKWVDIGHRKYLFAKTDFENNSFSPEDLVDIFDVLKKYNDEYTVMGRQTFQWILKKKDVKLKLDNVDKKRSIVVYDENGNEEIEIMAPDILGKSYVGFATNCKEEYYGKAFNLDYFFFFLESFKYSTKWERKDFYLANGSVNRYGIKVMKRK